MNATTLDSSYTGQYDHLVDRYGAPWYFLHRVDLHSELKRLAQQPTTHSDGAVIHLSSEVSSVDHVMGKIIFTDGKTVTKDLIVAADGVHVSLLV